MSQRKCGAKFLNVTQVLRITYDKSSSFQDLQRKGNSVSIHHRNIQALATEIFKVKNNIAPEILKEVERAFCS